jgi:predicted hydrocarbon binding protein
VPFLIIDVEAVMEENEQVTSMALRLVIDSYEDILGRGGKNSVLNYGGFTQLIYHPPAYDEKAMVPRKFLNGMIRTSIVVIGEVGTKTILVRAGTSTIRHLVEQNENIKALAENKDVPRIDKIKAILAFYSANANRPPLFEVTDRMATYRVPDCTLCFGMKTEKSYCTYIAGVFEGGARYIAGFKKARCEEVLCKAKGDAECTYEIYYEGTRD